MKQAIATKPMDASSFMDIVNAQSLNFELAHERLGVLGKGGVKGAIGDGADLRLTTKNDGSTHADALTEYGVLALEMCK